MNMPQGQSWFDATRVAPDQGVPSHPVGKFPARISATEVKPTKEQTGFYLQIEYTTPAGKAYDRLNLMNANAQAVEIAQKTLSAICHATGIYRLVTTNAAELLNAELQIEVAEQRGNAGYTQVIRRYDKNGNEPGKAATGGPSFAAPPQQQQPQPPMQPQQQQPATWGQPPQQQPQGQPPGASATGMQPGAQQAPQWGQPPQGQPQQQPGPQWGAPQGQPQQQPQPGPAGWQQNQQQAEQPPWGAR